MKVVIIGGVAGGASAAARLRRLDENAEIIMFERGQYISFANCGLPYYIGGAIQQKAALTLQTPESFNARFNVDVRVNSEVTSIDTAAKTVTVKTPSGEYTQEYDKLILSPGAKPIMPKLDGADSKKVFTLCNIPDTLKIKEYIENNNVKTAVVVGGGYIGVEMAENLAHAGIKTTIVEMADHLIAPLDYDMACDVHHYVKNCGIDLILSNAVKAIHEKEEGLTVELNSGCLDCDMLIMSVGVVPDTAFLASSPIERNAKGLIIVNDKMQTNIDDVYAVGDAVQVNNFVSDEPSFIPLAGPANKQGRIAADNICSLDSLYKGTQGSAVLKIFDMTVATTGLNERAAKSANINYDKIYTFSASHATYYPGANNMSVKILWDKSDNRIIGAQIVGFDGVDKRMDVIATAMRFGAKVTDLTELELCYAPPFGSAKDPVNMAGYVAENVISGKVKQFFWHDVDSLPRDGSVTLLDVRTPMERSRGYIDGFMHIPLDSLRENLDKIPSGKDVYIHCHSGLRSYIACRILQGKGFNTYNLAGGWRLYEAVVNDKKVKPYVCTECK